MDLEGTEFDKVIHNNDKKCEYCGKELKPKGYSYLYANISKDLIEYERCNCDKANEYWKNKDVEEIYSNNRKRYFKLMNKIFDENKIFIKLNKYTFDNFQVLDCNVKEINLLKKYLKECIDKKQNNGMILVGKAGTGKHI